jgi:5-formyltetrahydrofolate cyclo-ligase
MEKNLLRRSLLDKRKSMTPDEVKHASEAIVKKLKELPVIKESTVIMSFMPYGNETDIRPFNQWILDSGKILLLPRVLDDSNIDAVKVDEIKSGLVKGSFGILEPAYENESFPIEFIDVILVPGVAFVRKGNRMGHGRGYYDRFLSRCKKSTVYLGIAYSFQVLESIPFEEYDIRVHGVITDK